MSQQGSSNSNWEEGQEDVASSNHITVWECEDSNLEIELAEIPKTFEDGGKL